MKKVVAIPYKQALKLMEWRMSYLKGQALIQNAERQLEHERQKLTNIHEFAEIPTDKDVNIKLEDGPDKKGMIMVEWEEPDVTP